MLAAMLCTGGFVSLAIASGAGTSGVSGQTTESADDSSGGLAIESLGSINIPEDGTYSVEIDDIFFGGWEYILAAGNYYVNVTYDDVCLYFTPLADWSGVESIDLTAYYNVSVAPPPTQNLQKAAPPPVMPAWLAITKNILADVWPVNDPPRAVAGLFGDGLALTTETSMGVVLPVDIAEVFEDIDSMLSYSWSSDNGLVSADLAASELRSITAGQAAGSDVLKIVANDGEYVAEYSIPVSVVERDSVSMAEDAEASMCLSEYVDPEEQTCTMYGAESVAMSIDGGSQTALQAILTPSADWYGSDTVSMFVMPILNVIKPPTPINVIECVPPFPILPPEPVRATFGFYEFDVHVESVNDPPYVEAYIPTTLNTDEDTPIVGALDISERFCDIDSDLKFVAASQYGIVDAAIGQDDMLSISPVWNANGADIVVVSASDGEYTATSDVSVMVAPVNDVPAEEFDGILLETDEDIPAELNMTGLFSDVDSNLTYNITAGDGISFEIDNANLTALVTPAAEWHGTTMLKVTATDGESTSALDVYFVVNSVNDPVVQVGILPRIEFDEDREASVDLSAYFHDVDSSIGYSLDGIGDGLRATLDGCVLSLTAYPEWSGTGEVAIRATDGQFSASAESVVEVAAVDDEPVAVAGIGDVSVAEDGSIAIDLGAHYADIDSNLLFTMSGMSAVYAEIDANGLLEIQAPENWYGQEHITVRATGGENELTETFTVTFTPVNDAPMAVARIGAVSFASGGSQRIDLRRAFADPDGDMLTYAVTTPSGVAANIDQVAGVAVLSAPDGWNGSSEIVVTATDGVATSSATADIVVAAPAQAGTARAGLPIEVGYTLGGMLMVASAIAAVGLALYAREAALRHPVRRRVTRVAAAPS